MEKVKWKRGDEVIAELTTNALTNTIDCKPILDYLTKILDHEISRGYKLNVSIGTDSQKAGKPGVYKFATVILISTYEDLGGGVIVGRGGIVLHTIHYNQFKLRNKELVNERMVYEVGKSIEIAYEIAPLLDLYEIKLEIHADINPNPQHESNKALQQAVGYILGMGYEFKIKPAAISASYEAYRLC